MTKTGKTVCAEVIVNAGLEDVWEAWTTEEGVKTFLAPAGERGGEGNRVMAIQPMEMFSFTWNAPPTLPGVRDQRTHVTLRFFPEGGRTKVTLYHGGWGSGGQ